VRTITITIEDSACGFDVHENGKCCNGLSWDEMLGQVAMLTMPAFRLGNGFKMQTPEEWEAERKARRPSETEKAERDLLLCGTVILITESDGVQRHVPIDQVNVLLGASKDKGGAA